SSSKSQPTRPSPPLERASAETYALISSDDAVMGFDSPPPRSTMPYSVSMPQTLRRAMEGRYPAAPGSTPGRVRRRKLEVLARADPLDGPATGGLLALRQQGAHVHDALALLAGDLGPVVG